MRIGVPTEIKDNEYRVGMTPAGARDLTSDGHEVLVQKGAGNGSGFGDEEYTAAGAKILPDADAVFDAAEMIVKVKEPIAADLERLKDGQLLFTYLHLAPVPDLTEAAAQEEDHRRRLRDDHRRAQADAPAAHADVRSGRPHVGPRRRVLPAQAERRTRRAPRRRPGNAAGGRRHHRRRRGRHERRQDGRRPRRARDDPRHQPRPPPPARRHLPRHRADAGLQPRPHRRRRAPRRPAHRRRAHPRRRGAEARHPRHDRRR